jgi:hypothetical protein
MRDCAAALSDRRTGKNIRYSMADPDFKPS